MLAPYLECGRSRPHTERGVRPSRPPGREGPYPHYPPDGRFAGARFADRYTFSSGACATGRRRQYDVSTTGAEGLAKGVLFSRSASPHVSRPSMIDGRVGDRAVRGRLRPSEPAEPASQRSARGRPSDRVELHFLSVRIRRFEGGNQPGARPKRDALTRREVRPHSGRYVQRNRMRSLRISEEPSYALLKACDECAQRALFLRTNDLRLLVGACNLFRANGTILAMPGKWHRSTGSRPGSMHVPHMSVSAYQ